MQLQVSIDQKEAFKRGINAPHSLVKVEVDPSQLSQEVRDVIADVLQEGYRLDSFGGYSGLGPVLEPTQAGIVAQAEALIAKRKAAAAEVAAKRAEYLSELAKYGEAVLANPRANLMVGCDSRQMVYGNAPCWVYESWSRTNIAHPCRELPDEVNKVALEVGKEMIAEVLAKNEAGRAAEAAKRAEEVAAAAAYKAKLCVALTPELAEQFKEGFMSQEKAEMAVRNAYRKSLGVTFTGDSEAWDVDSFTEPSDLTPAEYAALKVFRSKLPEGSVITCFCGDRVDEDRSKRIIAVAEATFTHPDFPALKVSAQCLLSETHEEAE